MAQESSAIDFITQALRMIGITDAIDPPSPEDSQTGLTVLQDMIDDWATQRGLSITVAAVQFNLTQNKAVYTIGPGGDFNAARPEWIEGVSVIPDRTLTQPLEIDLGRMLSVKEFQDVPMKNIGMPFPAWAYYDNNAAAGLGQITIPPPTTATAALKLYYPSPLAQFVDLVTTYTFKPGYVRAIRYNLAVECADAWRQPLQARIAQKAAQALGNLKRANVAPKVAQFDAALSGSSSGSGYNARTDQG